MMKNQISGESILAMVRGFQQSAVVIAAAELDVFTILIRDIVMDGASTRPAGGALFAVNMLTATPAGGTFTFTELREDLISAGFRKVRRLCRSEWMDSVVSAVKP